MKLSSFLPTAFAALSLTTLASAERKYKTHQRQKVSSSSADVVIGNGTVQATLPSGDFVKVYLHGATVTSWKTSDGEDKLLLSTSSALDGSAAIRGGIPVVFPNFGSPPKDHQTSEMPSHGFARNSTWTYAGSAKEGSGIVLTFTLNSTQLTADYQKDWPYSAELTYTVSLTKNNLAVHFTVENTDKAAIDFQFLLHTYLSVSVSIGAKRGQWSID